MATVARVQTDRGPVLLMRYSPAEVNRITGGLSGSLAGGELGGKFGRKFKKAFKKVGKLIGKVGKSVLNAYTGGVGGKLLDAGKAAMTKDGGAIYAVPATAEAEAAAAAAMQAGALAPMGGGGFMSKLPKWAIPAGAAAVAGVLLLRKKR